MLYIYIYIYTYVYIHSNINNNNTNNSNIPCPQVLSDMLSSKLPVSPRQVRVSNARRSDFVYYHMPCVYIYI